MKPQNMLFIMSDEHSNQTMGCSGHSMVRTPNLDALAARGTRFTANYTPSPICVPARAALATGRYPHQTRNWCNGTPYFGEIGGWNHRLQEQGHRVVSIGKLHFRNETDDTGFDEQIIPMHVVNGVGDVAGAVRDQLPLPVRYQCKKLSEGVGGGDSPYLQYDRDILRESCNWLQEKAAKHTDKPWLLFVSFVCPHFPLVAPPEFYQLYDRSRLPELKATPGSGYKRHPWIDALAKCQIYDQYFTDETRSKARAAYLGMVSFLDDNIGTLLRTLEDSGLAGDTRVIYTSDHGDNLGARGLWGKSNFYEESAGIPLIMTGDGVPVGKVSNTAANLLDCYPTILDCAGIELTDEEENLPGQSLYDIAAEGDDSTRAVGGEYHAAGAASGAFMIRRGRYKYVHYVGYPSELFDLEADPEEMNNLADSADAAEIREGLERILHSMFDPEAIDKLAHDDQAALVAKHGGRDAVLNRGGFSGTPIPGETAEFVSSN
jgi:choline-sulfatase